MKVKEYLQRIKYTDDTDPTLQVLAKLQFTHLIHVPFENLDIHTNTRIDLTNLFDKIVTRKRGGFCYELNGLFYELLKEIGFKVKMVSARVYNDKKDYSPEFDHMALVVQIENEKFLVDVGFGDFALGPLKLDPHQDTNDAAGVFKIEAFDENYKVVKKKNAEGIFIPEYIFSEKERQMEEFFDRCNYHQTNNESHFKQKRVCSLPTNKGRITLTGDVLKIKEAGKITERKLMNEEQVNHELWNYFEIKI